MADMRFFRLLCVSTLVMTSSAVLVACSGVLCPWASASRSKYSSMKVATRCGARNTSNKDEVNRRFLGAIWLQKFRLLEDIWEQFG